LKCPRHLGLDEEIVEGIAVHIEGDGGPTEEGSPPPSVVLRRPANPPKHAPASHRKQGGTPKPGQQAARKPPTQGTWQLCAIPQH
jgi:hypothetical protein